MFKDANNRRSDSYCSFFTSHAAGNLTEREKSQIKAFGQAAPKAPVV